MPEASGTVDLEGETVALVGPVGVAGVYAGAGAPLDPSMVIRMPDHTITGLLETTQ